MNKSEEIKSIKVAQRELADRLEALEQEPEQRKPEAGDVWAWNDPYSYLVDSEDGLVQLPYGKLCRASATTHCAFELATYLGKFDEVYCKISDVREALHHQRIFGIDSIPSVDFEALRKLNIIK